MARREGSAIGTSAKVLYQATEHLLPRPCDRALSQVFGTKDASPACRAGTC